MKALSCASFIALSISSISLAAPAFELVDPAGNVPVVQNVDVLVVGGSAAGVEAAVEAAKNGASVFLVAPRTYLGDDICATYRFWLEKGEVPFDKLSRDIFWASAPEMTLVRNQLSFAYSTSRKPWIGLPDKTGTTLSDGKWGDSRTQSVQYDGDVAITLDLKRVQTIRSVSSMVYQRPGDFKVERIGVGVSSDGKQWQSLGEVVNPNNRGEAFVEKALVLRADATASARFIKLEFHKAPDCDRILLGEIVVEGDATVDAATMERAQLAAAMPTPMQVKRALDKALLDAKVPYLFSSFPLDVLVDEKGQPAGILMGNQSGRQAVIAKTIIDATELATVARIAGANFEESSVRIQTFRRVVVGGPQRVADQIRYITHEPSRYVTDSKGKQSKIHEYEITLPLKGRGYAAEVEAEQSARDLTWTAESIDASERLFEIPLDIIRGKRRMDERWAGPDVVPLEAMVPQAVDRLYVLSGCADLSRENAAHLLRPINLMAVGKRLGQFAAEAAKSTEPLKGVHRANRMIAGNPEAVVHYPTPQGNYRATGVVVPVAESGIAVLAEYEVIVAGGGTGGAPATISAGRAGAKTAVVELLNTLGGVGTAGMVSLYYNGNHVGFTEEIDAGVAKMGGVLGIKDEPGLAPKSLEWVPNIKAEWYRQEMRKTNVDIWFNTLVLGAVTVGNSVRGIVVATPYGCGVILGRLVVDSTGNAAVAAAAGGLCTYPGASEIAVQGTGLPPSFLDPRYINTDYTYVDETDVLDIWRAFVAAREKFSENYDLGQLIDTRERRRIIGDVELAPTDAILRRTWPDTIEIAKSDFDTHGYTVHPLFLLRQPDRTQYEVPIPYRCLLPRDLDGILVTGVGISVHRDTLPLVRMQRDIQNQGYAAGAAAAMLAHSGLPTRQLDIKALQKHLVEKNILPPSVLTDGDSFPLKPEQIRSAVRSLVENYGNIATILAQPADSIPLLRDALRETSYARAKLTYAHVLGMLGDDAGSKVLVEELTRSHWDAGWNFKAMGQYNASLSRVDSLIIALGRTRDPAGIAPILALARQLTSESEFSHFRAIALALEAIGDRAAAKTLADMLRMPKISGHSVTTISAALENVQPEKEKDATRARELAEIGLARALYRCGDYEGQGAATLHSYENDLRGYYARHARAVLAEPVKLR